MKLTKWYPAHIKPVRKGWYDTNIPTFKGCTESPFRWYWNGKQWVFSDNKKSLVSSNQNRMWRGIVK